MDSKIAIKQKSFFEIKKDINYLTASYPFLNLKILSSSTLGREIYSITLGKASEYVYFVSSFCGNDTLTSLILLRFLEDLSSNIYCGNEMAGVNIRKATSGKGIVFVPLINPDGHEIAVKGFSSASYLYNVLNKNCNCSHKDYKYNLRGVFLENNFYKGVVGSPYKNTFGGFSPFSEPESLALAENLRKYPPRQIVCLNQTKDYVGIFQPKDNSRTKKMSEVTRAVYPKKQVIEENNNSFGSWVAKEFNAPTFNIGLSGLTEANLIKNYNQLKELLVLMLIM